MFSLIKEIHQEYGGTYQSNDDFADRRNLVTDTVKLIANKIDPTMQIVVKISADPYEGPCSRSIAFKKGVVYLPSFVLYDLDEVPSDVGFTSSQDPKLKNKEDIVKFTNWLTSTIPFQKDVEYKKAHAIAIRALLISHKNPEKAKDTFLFVIGHELGHIKYHDSAGYKNRFLDRTTFGLFSNILGLRQEKRADRFAYSQSERMARGGIYGFKCFKRAIKDSRNDHSLFRLLFSKKGKFRLPRILVDEHPSETARIKAIRSYLKG